MHGRVDEETSIEESVLQELEMVMTQVNLDFKIRIIAHCDDAHSFIDSKLLCFGLIS